MFENADDKYIFFPSSSYVEFSRITPERIKYKYKNSLNQEEM